MALVGSAQRVRERAVTQTTNSNPLGLETPPADDIETTPEHYNLIGGDPACAGWTRSYDDPNVVQLREQLKRHNGIKGLEVLDPARSSGRPSCSIATASSSCATCSAPSSWRG